MRDGCSACRCLPRTQVHKFNAAAVQFHTGVADVLDKLRRLRCPLFAFGQTVCWDEPMKAVLMEALRRSRMNISFVVGIHDTDYFSKVHRYLPTAERFVIIPRNDGSLANAWAAICEASILFGSETPPTVREYLHCQIPFRQLAKEASEGKRAFTDRWTEAWGWRAVVYNAPRAPVAAQVRGSDILPHLKMLMEWGLYGTLDMLTEPTEAQRCAAEEILNSLHVAHEVAMASDDDSISGFYEQFYRILLKRLLGYMPSFVSFTCSSRFFQFNTATYGRRRFNVLDVFLAPDTRTIAVDAYNNAVAGTGIYELSEFGDGALPFDLYAPKLGRGTIRIERDWLHIRFRGYASQEKSVKASGIIDSRWRLAECIEDAFGRDCALVGKALMTPVMICSEGVMVLNEMGSRYIPLTQWFVRALNSAGVVLQLFPILRLRYPTFDAMRVLSIRLRLPDHIAHFLHAAEVSAVEFAEGWRDAVRDANATVEQMSKVRAVSDVLTLLDDANCGSESFLGELQREYQDVRRQLQAIGRMLTEWQHASLQCWCDEREVLHQLEAQQRLSGELRRTIREAMQAATSPSDLDQLRRAHKDAQRKVHQLLRHLNRLRAQRHQLVQRMRTLAYSDAARQLRERRTSIERKVLMEKLKLARKALLTRALPYSHCRPCAWWFMLIDPSGKWFDAVCKQTEMRFEEWLTHQC